MPAALYAFVTCLMTDGIIRLGKIPQPFSGALTGKCAGHADGPDVQRKADFEGLRMFQIQTF